MDFQRYRGINEDNLSDYAEANVLDLDSKSRTEISSHEREGLEAEAKQGEIAAKVSHFYSE